MVEEQDFDLVSVVRVDDKRTNIQFLFNGELGDWRNATTIANRDPEGQARPDEHLALSRHNCVYRRVQVVSDRVGRTEYGKVSILGNFLHCQFDL